MSAPIPVSPPPSPSPQDGVERFRRMVWWSTVGVVYAAGVFLVVAILVPEPRGVATALGAVGAACGAGASGRLLDRRLGAMSALNPGGPFEAPRGFTFTAAAGALMVMLAAPLAAGTPTWAIVPGVVVGAIAVWVPRSRRPWTVVGAVVAATVVVVSLRLLIAGEVEASEDIVNALLMGLIAVALISTMWSWDVVVRLDRTRLLEAELAVADERLRFAADLHDVQGHHLHVIALESELATRLAESDPEAARAHMQQVYEHARSALHETRDLVHGYRRASLGAELANATRVLTAAGIDGRLGRGTEEIADDLPEEGRHLLGLVVREATTNVLRHSHAQQARLTLEAVGEWARLRVSNDGAAAPEGEEGSGLPTLADRLSAAGGHLEWGNEAGWFTVDARVPVNGGHG